MLQNSKFIWRPEKSKSKSQKKKKRLTSMMENKHFDDFTVSLEINTKIRNSLSYVKVFGIVSMETNEKLINRKSRQAQISTTVVKSFDDIKFKQVNKFYSGSKQVTGCIILPADEWHLLNTITSDRLSECPDFKIPLKESSVFDLTIIDIRTVAVSFGWHSFDDKACIKMIDINSGENTKTIDTKSRVYGIVCVDDNFVYLGYSPNGIYKIDLNTNVESVISKAINLCSGSYITNLNNQFYVTNERCCTVTSFDTKGNVIWDYKDNANMIKPKGISVDNSGNVFVASAGSNNVTLISPDGSRAKQKLDNQDGLGESCALHYDCSTNHLLVTNYMGTAFLFEAI